jgi:hypothetical protein
LKTSEIIFGFLNCQGLQLGKRENMARECKVGKIDFLGLAETRMIEEHSLIEGYRIVGKGGRE